LVPDLFLDIIVVYPFERIADDAREIACDAFRVHLDIPPPSILLAVLRMFKLCVRISLDVP
jgi:hypothetical protein